MNLMRDVSRDELLRMREEGMTNREISDSLDVSYNTVLRIIGKQPSGLRKQPERIPEHTVPTVEQTPDPCLTVMNRNIQLLGNAAEYNLDCSKETVEITIDGQSVCIPFQKIEIMMNELAAIMRHIPSVKAVDESW